MFLAVVIAAALPVLVHAIPWQAEVPLGARLLPIFLAPALVVLLGWGPWAVLVTAAAPLLNHLLTGRPSAAMLWTLSLEVLVFACLVAAGWRLRPLRWVLLPLAYLIATAVAGGVDALLAAPVRSGPGLLLLAVLGVLAAHRTRSRP